MFAKIPEELIPYSGNVIKLYAYYCIEAHKQNYGKNYCHLSMATISRDTILHKNTIIRSNKILQQNKIIEIQKNYNMPNKIILLLENKDELLDRVGYYPGMPEQEIQKRLTYFDIHHSMDEYRP